MTTTKSIEELMQTVYASNGAHANDHPAQHWKTQEVKQYAEALIAETVAPLHARIAELEADNASLQASFDQRGRNNAALLAQIKSLLTTLAVSPVVKDETEAFALREQVGRLEAALAAQGAEPVVWIDEHGYPRRDGQSTDVLEVFDVRSAWLYTRPPAAEQTLDLIATAEFLLTSMQPGPGNAVAVKYDSDGNPMVYCVSSRIDFDGHKIHTINVPWAIDGDAWSKGILQFTDPGSEQAEALKDAVAEFLSAWDDEDDEKDFSQELNQIRAAIASAEGGV